MASHVIDVQIAPEYEERISGEWLRRAARATLVAEGETRDVTLTIVVTDDDTIHVLNRDYRNVDRPTDVLAFAMSEGPDLTLPNSLPCNLGDVIVSFPRAQEQAIDNCHPIERELAFLIVHGCLHLLGYDHANELERQQMWSRQQAVLDSLLA